MIHPRSLRVTHQQQRPVRVLLGHLKGEARHHGLLHAAHVAQRLALLDGHLLLVLGLDQGLELIQGGLQLGQSSQAGVLHREKQQQGVSRQEAQC